MRKAEDRASFDDGFADVTFRLMRCGAAYGLVLLLGLNCVGQEPQPDAGGFQLQSKVRRVVVDVVVTDAKGHTVTGLGAEDFNVFEDGTAQPVKSFEPHSYDAVGEYLPPKVLKLPPNTFLNLPTAPTQGTPTVLLYDVLNTPLEAQGYMHQEMVKFLRRHRDGTQIAIFVLSDRLHLLQGFTSDNDRILRALGEHKGATSPSALLSSGGTNATSATSLVPPPSQAAQPGAVFQDSNVSQTSDSLNTMESLEQSYQIDRRVDITLDAFIQIGRFLAALPGRKNLLWLSASFPAGVLPDANISAGTLGHDQSTRNYGPQMKEASDVLSLGHVAVYPVDVRGVQVNPAYSAASTRTLGQGGREAVQAIQSFTTQQAAEHSSMDSIAESTGGHAYYSTNDLEQAVNDAMENGTKYYTLTYAPTNSAFDGSLRKIRVTLRRPGYKLAYRTSYFADDAAATAQAVAEGPVNPLTPSLTYGSPLSHELLMEVHISATGKPVPATPRQTQMLAEYEAIHQGKKGRSNAPSAPVMMQAYVLQYGLIPRQIDFKPGPNHTHVTSLQLAVLSYDREGLKLNGIETTMQDSFAPARYAQLSEQGYHFFQTFIAPLTATSLRVAVRDGESGRIGTMDIPLPLVQAP